MKTVYLEYRSEPITISDEAYEQVKGIIEGASICQQCYHLYSAANPQVAQNECLSCFLGERRHNQHLTYIGQREYTPPYDETKCYTYHRFIDSKGYIYESSPSSHSGNSAEKDEYLTLLYWGFRIPDSFTYNGQEVELRRYGWSIYGDMKERAVVIHYQDRGGNYKSYPFVVSKDAPALFLDKRKKAVRDLLAEARKNIEATKDANGYYHPHDGYGERSWISESDLYADIAFLESQRLQKA